MKSKKKIAVSTLRAQAAAMVANGTMPTLETVLAAVASVRAEYRDKILQARREDR